MSTKTLAALCPTQWISEDPQASDVDAIVNFLTAQGTFYFPTLSTGLFSAAAAENPEFRMTGYQNVWVRDNIHVAHALWVIGEKQIAVAAVRSFVQFYEKYRHKFVDIIEGRVDPREVQLRPHIRFDGESLSENEESWAHAQNDALGYFLWLTSILLRAGDLATDEELELQLVLLVQYFHQIEFWQDEDSGHWEETKKIEASSIGAVVAGLMQLQAWWEESDSQAPSPVRELLEFCLERGQQALAEILPNECIQEDPSQYRAHDAALLFLSYPLNVIDSEQSLQIATEVRENLMGPIGIKRYRGDSYWCADYRTLLAPEKRTTDFSEDTSSRDALLQAGQEAQWCLFDPILSIIHARRYLEYGLAEDRQLQIEYLRRSLGQLTRADSRFPPYRCPESYFLENGQWIPNDICPLLWTQANLRLGLHWLKLTAR